MDSLVVAVPGMNDDTICLGRLLREGGGGSDLGGIGDIHIRRRPVGTELPQLVVIWEVLQNSKRRPPTPVAGQCCYYFYSRYGKKFSGRWYY
jgi:hypothetical protein